MTATEVTTGKPTKFVDVLPRRKGGTIALEWYPHAENFEHGEGFVVLTGARDRTAYSVVEGPTHAGRAFLLTKVGGKGTDHKRESYIVIADHDGLNPRCECEGARRHGFCKHGDCIETLISNRWL